jgi:opacity protein-like surface antigen
MTWGFQAGIGIDVFKKLAVDARYEGSLSKYGDSFNVGGTDHNFDARPSQWIIALGWWF